MIKARLGADLDRIVRRVFPFIAQIRIHPDLLTLFGAGVALLAGWAFARDARLGAGLLLIVSGFFDLIDGVVARQQGRASVAGAFFDSSIDRLSDLLIFGGIAIAEARAGDGLGVGLVMWALSGSIMTSYTRASAERKLSSLGMGFMERGERFGLLILGALTGWLEAALLAVALGSTITACQRLYEGRRLLAVLEETGEDPTRSPDPAESADRGDEEV